VGSSKAWLFKFGMLFGIGRSSGKLGWLSGRIERDFLEKEGVFVLERGVLEEDRISGGGRRIESHLPGCELSTWRRI
jgi:hypothetical protein